MRTFIVLAVLVAVASAAIVKRDAPDANNLSKMAEDVMAKFHQAAENAVQGTALENVFKNTTAIFSETIAKLDTQIKDAAPNVQAQMRKAQDDMKKAYDKFANSKEGLSIAKFNEELEKVFADAKANDYLGKLGETMQKLSVQASALMKDASSQIAAVGN